MLSAAVWPAALGVVDSKRADIWGLNHHTISTNISAHIANNEYPQKLIFPQTMIDQPLSIDYTFDQSLQQFIAKKLRKHNPDYGVIAVIDPHSGRILAMADSTRDTIEHGNLAIRGSYPAASISKIITATAAIDQGVATADTDFAFNGKATSLYKQHVFNHEDTEWSRHYSLTESFAKSVNVVFGRLGAVDLGGDVLLDYAAKLGFNGRFASDFMFDNGSIKMDPDDRWQVAETASGYTRNNRLSPLHGAVLAATIVNGGELIAPMLVDAILDPNGLPLYTYDMVAKTRVISPASARQLQQLMQATVKIGSARRSFRQLNQGKLTDIVIGGKTGTLSGFEPQGKYDWFVGYAQRAERSIAFAVLCINKDKWYVKSARLAREMIEFYFRRPNPATQPKLSIKTAA